MYTYMHFSVQTLDSVIKGYEVYVLDSCECINFMYIHIRTCIHDVSICTFTCMCMYVYIIYIHMYMYKIKYTTYCP